MILIDGADPLLSRSQAQRRASLDALEHFIRHVVEHPVVPVLIGTPERADTLSASRATHVVRVDAMALDDEFGLVVGMLFGTRDADEVATLHRQSAGLIGRLAHIARMRGLTPPFNVPGVEIRRLPGPAADWDPDRDDRSCGRPRPLPMERRQRGRSPRRRAAQV